jgi:hypothetical protein
LSLIEFSRLKKTKERVKMTTTLSDVKKSLKGFESVRLVNVSLEEFGEGYNVYVDVYAVDINGKKKLEAFTMAEEEKKSKAKARAKRIVESLEKNNVKALYLGIATIFEGKLVYEL